MRMRTRNLEWMVEEEEEEGQLWSWDQLSWNFVVRIIKTTLPRFSPLRKVIGLCKSSCSLPCGRWTQMMSRWTMTLLEMSVTDLLLWRGKGPRVWASAFWHPLSYILACSGCWNRGPGLTGLWTTLISCYSGGWEIQDQGKDWFGA